MEIAIKKLLRKPTQVEPLASYEALRNYFNIFYSTKKLVKNDKADEIVDLVLRYFAKDESFLKSDKIQNKPSFDKGLFLVGNVGTGKTFVFEFIKYLESKQYNHLVDPPPLTVVHASSLVNDVNEIYTHRLTKQNNVMIDDIGKEPKEYGEYTSIKQVISARYDKALLTHLTSNLNLEELTGMYGLHILDRIKQMCNVVVIDMPSLRI